MHSTNRENAKGVILMKKYTAPRTSEQEIVFDGTPVAVLQKPQLWDGSEGTKTEVQATWNSVGLHVGFKIYGSFRPFNKESENKFNLNNDDRVEAFVMPPNSDIYYGYEVNPYLQFLNYKARFIRKLDFSWNGSAKAELCSKDGLPFLIISIPWSDLSLQYPPPNKGMKIGFYRGQSIISKDKEKMNDFAWTCWVDPSQTPEPFTFHRPETFGELELIS